MSKTQQQEEKPTRKDDQGNEFDMSAHIPEGTDSAHEVERDMSAKLNDIGEGLHTTSTTFGEVVSDEATDAAGLTPQVMAEQAEERGVKTSTSDKKSDKSSTSDKSSSKKSDK